MRLNRAQKKLLLSKINELPPTVKDTPFEVFINRLYDELEISGISFKPKTYLTDEWGCPNKVPIIGIPFYLVNPEVSSLVHKLTGIKVRDDKEVMKLLRHEAGHTFNYAYHIYRKPKWSRLFGKFSKPYAAIYNPIPFSPNFVVNMPQWYAQRHPDDDFA
jgi:hypothetical protein